MKTNNPKPMALVTGGSGGIGFEIARQFVLNGHDVILVAENKPKLMIAANKLQAENSDAHIEVIVADLSRATAPERVFKTVSKMEFEVSVLVNNAGVGVYGEFGEDTALEAELALIQLNVISAVHLTKLFLPQMLKRGVGKILFTSSIAAITSTPLLSVYGATKAFGYIFAEGLRDEVKDKGITVTALMPGATDTDFFNRAGARNTEIAQNKENLADPADVAKEAYRALMAGDDHVIPGFKNKVMAMVADVIPKEVTAHNARLKQAGQ